MKASAIIVAAGTGSRAGGSVPKQIQLLGGRPVLEWSLSALRTHDRIRDIIIVTSEALRSDIASIAKRYAAELVIGGETRAQSVLNGLNVLSVDDQTPVLIHDAARPGIGQAMITLLLDKLTGCDAVAPALPLSDALKRVNGDRLHNVDKTGLSRVQTPQVFRYGMIKSALKSAGPSVVDDLQAVEGLGVRVTLIRGAHQLHKLTYAEDFTMLEHLLVANHMPRIGKGFDVHAFGDGDHVTLCGVAIKHTNGLKGHSDADVGWHALTDAILGALALGDIGDHFPPSDDKWKGANSAVFLKEAMQLAAQQNYTLGNCDITLICEAPRISTHKTAMREATAGILGVSPAQISIKATTTEKLGFTGRGEGIAAEAIAVMIRNSQETNA